MIGDAFYFILFFEIGSCFVAQAYMQSPCFSLRAQFMISYSCKLIIQWGKGKERDCGWLDNKGSSGQ